MHKKNSTLSDTNLNPDLLLSDFKSQVSCMHPLIIFSTLSLILLAASQKLPCDSPSTPSKMSANQERTFIMLKPDAVHRGLVGEIIKRFEAKGFKLVAMKMKHVSLKFNYLKLILN